MLTNGTLCNPNLYDYIIFYRWFSPDGVYEHGRVMARLVAQMIEKDSRRRTWLDQREMTRTMAPKLVVDKIAAVFPSVSQVIILAGPGDWQRFANELDIHRPEDNMTPSKQDLVIGLETYSSRLAELAANRDNVHTRFLSMDSIDTVLKEIAEAA